MSLDQLSSPVSDGVRGRMLDPSAAEDLFVDNLLHDVLRRLDGTHQDMATFQYDDKPSKIILLGTLAPPKRDLLSRTTAVDNSISASFLVQSESRVDLDVRVHLAVFYKAVPSYRWQILYHSFLLEKAGG